MDTTKTFLFAGGGTGGHLFPGIAVAQQLKQRHPAARIVFVGSTRAIEATIINHDEYGFEHRTIPAEPLPTLRKNPLRFFWRNWKSWRTAARILRELRPDAVIGLGGFASAPVVWAASRMRIPVILLEPNVIPGRTTRWLSRFARSVCVSFEETRLQLPRAYQIVVTGNPIRPEIAAVELINSTENRLNEQMESKPSLLILGGSQGADSLNEAVLAAVRELRDSFIGWNIAHQSGPRQKDLVRQSYDQMGLSASVEAFFSDMSKRYSSASLVISRAGATTLAELACAGVPMILLPYPHAMDDHQHANAQSFVDGNAAILVKHASQPATTAGELVNALRQLLEDSDRRTRMGIAAKQLARPDAAKQVANLIDETIDLHRRPVTDIQ